MIEYLEITNTRRLFISSYDRQYCIHSDNFVRSRIHWHFSLDLRVKLFLRKSSNYRECCVFSLFVEILKFLTVCSKVNSVDFRWETIRRCVKFWCTQSTISWSLRSRQARRSLTPFVFTKRKRPKIIEMFKAKLLALLFDHLELNLTLTKKVKKPLNEQGK